jgi:hypothetical protein
MGVYSTPHLAWYTEIMDRVSTLSILSILKLDFQPDPYTPHGSGFFFAVKQITLAVLSGGIMTPTSLTLSGLSRVTGVRMPTLLRWWDRKTIESDLTTSGSGEYRRYDLHTITKVAIAAKLTPLMGITAGQALAAAAQYTDFGDETRTANTLYEFGRTVLVHTSAGTTIKNIDSDDSIADVLGRPMPPAIILDIGPIIEEVNSKLKEEIKRK